MHTVLSWKLEPVSPLSTEEASLLDETLYQSSFDDVKLELNDSLEDCESKAEVASHILENLEKLVDLDELIKEEPSFYLDDKMIPLIDEVQPPRGAIAVPVPLKSEYYKPEQAGTYLFNEFEKVYFELNHNTLTPPQSPPSEPTVITTLEPLMGVTVYHHVPVVVPNVSEKFSVTPDSSGYSGTPQPDIAHELAVVDELVRSTIDDMQWTSGPSSPESSSNSNFGDCSSSCSGSEDPEWTLDPENCKDTPFSPLGGHQKQKKRAKPYSASSNEKKSRKKEQNKNAATRYRMKKKAEVEEILNEEKGLLDKHGDLTNEITDLQREIKYLKGLMRDLLKAKGLIS